MNDIEKLETLIKGFKGLIVGKIKTLSNWKKGNYEFKEIQIKHCLNDIEFYKSQKKRFEIELKKLRS